MTRRCRNCGALEEISDGDKYVPPCCMHPKMVAQRKKKTYPGRVRPRAEKPTLTDQRRKVSARFAQQPNGCLHWAGPMTSLGYPRIHWQGKQRNGYRYALLVLFQGNPPPLSPRITACPHDRRCCHPDHLSWRKETE